MAWGQPHIHHDVIDSTNARMRELAEQGATSGTVVTASEQSAGRGRQGRTWFAPPDSALLYSALLRPLGDRPLLPLAVPLAVAEAAESLAPVTCELKWPNDVWVGGRKLAGVLIEGRPETGGGWAVIGVGLNLDLPEESLPEELRGRVASLGGRVTPDAARAAVNAALAKWVEEPTESVLAGFRERDYLYGRELSWEGGEGVAAGIDDSGHLLVDTGAGRVELGAGEVHLALA